MNRVYGVLDMCGRVSWRINSFILNTVEELWNLGGGVGEIPPRYYDYQDYVYEFHLSECKEP